MRVPTSARGLDGVSACAQLEHPPGPPWASCFLCWGLCGLFGHPKAIIILLALQPSLELQMRDWRQCFVNCPTYDL